MTADALAPCVARSSVATILSICRINRYVSSIGKDTKVNDIDISNTITVNCKDYFAEVKLCYFNQSYHRIIVKLKLQNIEA